MAKPSREDFDKLFELADTMPYSSIPYDRFDDVIPDEEKLKEQFRAHFDQYQKYITKLEQLKVHQWACSQYPWKMFKKALFGSENAERVSREVFVEQATRRLMSYYKPFTTVDHYLYKQSYKRGLRENLAKYISHYTKHGVSEDEVKRRFSKTFPMKSFEQLNDEQTRLEKFNFKKEGFFYYRPDIELIILRQLGRYFYEKDYLAEPTGNFYLDEEEVACYENEASFYADAYESVEKTITAVKHFLSTHLDMFDENDIVKLDENEDLDWNQAEIKKNIDLLLQLEDIKEQFGWRHSSALSELNGPEDEPLIQRVDRTARERVFSYSLWNHFREYKKHRPVRAIEWLLQLEGIENTPERRTIERWLKSWEEKSQENDRHLNDVLFKLEL